MNIERLIKLTKEPSFRIPSGLTREERRKWSKDIEEDWNMHKKEYSADEVLFTIKDTKTGKWRLCNPAVFEGEDFSGDCYSLYSPEEIKAFEDKLNGENNGKSD